ncbi:MATE family efflux transporter [Erysipelotrichaceae bacterium OH741_COT-311]|nr:MATE family efflux transporter [Erysipelotrichaceae bacterium OH741_COT-311]
MRQSDKMANWSIPKLLYSMSIPAVFSMFVQAMYNIVDTIYVSQISEDALFSIGLVFPVQMLLISIALGTSVGSGSLIARRLGAKNYEEANKVATTGLVLTTINYIVIALAGFMLTKQFVMLFTSRDVIVTMASDYLSIVMIFSVGMFMAIYFERVLQSQGNMIVPMLSQLIGAVINIILDPLFIFGFGFIPALGIKGAAIATITAQFASVVFMQVVFWKIKKDVHIELKGFQLQWKRIKDIYSIGIPVAFISALSSVAITIVNGLLISISELGVNALSIYFKLQSFVFMPCFGFNQGTLPILSYSYGAKDYHRYIKTFRLYVTTTISITLLGALMFWLHTDFFINLFHPSQELLVITRDTLRIISLCYFFYALSIAMGTIFQSLGIGVYSMYMAILRQVILLLPLAYLLSHFFGLTGVWMAYPITEAVICMVFVPICIKNVKMKFNRA